MLDAGGKPESTVWAHGDRLPVTATAFLNSMYGAALEGVADMATLFHDV